MSYAPAAPVHEADILVLSVPLWNFTISYKLKHFIDLVSQMEIFFSFGPEAGFSGLQENNRAVVDYA
ncbi:NAD(P)H-dependent oxidoreductase [Halomonas maura]|uniref:NAD(P)H-dependent oxidoreductase n=1 Tax=Halomonas maura TaxID=117606 RepID=UPI0025B2CDE6|nr:NAD(P)H-dependent oxidoreductase [Halomonas maura]MDN3556887.1 NAD(P)H-dependent oxidoreductase [Halomonas maura]